MTPLRCIACGLCCKLFYIPLNKKEWESKEYQTQFSSFASKDSYTKAKTYGGTLLQTHEDGSCIYQKDNRCSIHERRPRACRAFFCSTKAKKFQSMVEIIQKERNKTP